MKKAFTLIEVMISITIFSIIIIFLYQALNITQKSNDLYSEKLTLKQDENSLKKMLFLDLVNIKKSKPSKSTKKDKEIAKVSSDLKIYKDKDSNSIVSFRTSNIYHNPFYKHITYLLSKENNLIRIESKTKFDTKKLNDKFFDTAYIDIVYRNLIKFKVYEDKKHNKINMMFEDKNQQRRYLSF